MDASDPVSFEACPSCGGAATVDWLEWDLRAIDCHNGCAPRLAQTPAFTASHDLDAISRAAVVIGLFKQAILDTAATFDLADPREAAALVADAYAEVLQAEGRSLGSVESATAAVREIGERMHFLHR
jgi:hypothetical protein